MLHFGLSFATPSMVLLLVPHICLVLNEQFCSSTCERQSIVPRAIDISSISPSLYLPRCSSGEFEMKTCSSRDLQRELVQFDGLQNTDNIACPRHFKLVDEVTHTQSARITTLVSDECPLCTDVLRYSRACRRMSGLGRCQDTSRQQQKINVTSHRSLAR